MVSGGLGGAVGFFVRSSVRDASECLEKVKVGLESASSWNQLLAGWRRVIAEKCNRTSSSMKQKLRICSIDACRPRWSVNRGTFFFFS